MVKSEDFKRQIFLFLYRSRLFLYFFGFSGIGFCVISTRFFWYKGFRHRSPTARSFRLHIIFPKVRYKNRGMDSLRDLRFEI